jgi:PAS domain S-box-containing protein
VSTSSGGGPAAPDQAYPVEQPTPAKPAINGEAAAASRAGLIDGFSQELLQALPVAVYTTDAEGRITSFNEAAAALWGCRPVLGKAKFSGSHRLYAADGTLLPHDESPMALALKQKRSIRGMEAITERPDGTRVPFIPYPTPVFDASGEVTGAINVLVDISHSRNAEASLARRMDEQAALYHLTDRLYRAASQADICEAALDAIIRALRCEKASILLFDDAGIMRFAASRGLSATYRRAVEGHSPWTRDVKDPQPICIEDVETADLSESLKNTVQTEGIGALAFIPLVANGELIGKFMTYYHARHVFSEAELALALTIARQLGFGLERKRSEQALREVQRQLASELAVTQQLQQVSSELISECDVEALYEKILDAAVAIVRSDFVSMQMFYPQRGELRLLAYRGFSPTAAAFWEWVRPGSGSTCGAALATGNRSVVADIEMSDFMAGSEDLETYRQTGICAVQSTPLVSRDGRLVGMISTHWRNPHQPSERDFRLLDVLARQAADLIERKLAEHTAQRLAAIVDSSRDAIVSKDLNGLITTWNRGAEQLFGYTADEMIGKPITTLIPPDRNNEEVSILERIRRGERVDHYETVRQRKDGSLVDISLTVSPLKDAAGRVIGASKIARDISEKKQNQARQELLTREIQHRTKNLFAVVLAVVSRSFAGKNTVKDAEEAVVSRLRSLGQTHVILLDKEWQGADLAEIVRAEIGPYAGRVKVEGPSLMLTAKAAQNFALALHELATNAAKYGALSNTAGRIHITWSKHASHGPDDFTFRWQEQGGPPVRTPTEKGFGSAVLEQVMAEHFDVPPQIQFAPAGVIYELNGSLGTLVQTNEYCPAEDAHEPA